MVIVASQAHEKAQLALKMHFGNGLKVRTFRVLAWVVSNIYVYGCVTDLFTLRSFTFFYFLKPCAWFGAAAECPEGCGEECRALAPGPMAGGWISAGLLYTGGSDN